MNPPDAWIIEQLPSDPPHMALVWMDAQGIRYTDHDYQHFRNVINRKMKILEKYGMVRWTGEIADRNGAKVWVKA